MRSTRTSGRTRCKNLVPYIFAAGLLVWASVFGTALIFDGGQGEAGGVAEGGGEPATDPADRETPAGGGYEEVDRAEAEGAEGGEGRGRDPLGTRLPRGASGDGEAPYDPLGTGAEAGTLSETDLSRARLAAFRFVDAAYDFEGSGPAARLEYLEEVNRTVDAPEFWKSPESPGSDPAELVAKKTAEYGVENEALFRSFRVEETSSERVIGVATFALDEGGGEKTYEQRLVLGRWAAVWRVLYAKPLEEAS